MIIHVFKDVKSFLPRLPGLVGILQGRLLVALVGPQDEAIGAHRRLAAQAIEGQLLLRMLGARHPAVYHVIYDVHLYNGYHSTI